MFDGTKVQKISEIAKEKRNYFGVSFKKAKSEFSLCNQELAN